MNREEYIKKLSKLLEDVECTGFRCEHETSNKHYIISDLDFEALYQLHIEGVRDVIGEDEKQIWGKSIDDFKYPRAKTRNQLRAEQREKLKK